MYSEFIPSLKSDSRNGITNVEDACEEWVKLSWNVKAEKKATFNTWLNVVYAFKYTCD